MVNITLTSSLLLVGNHNPSFVRILKYTLRLINPNFLRTIYDSPDFILNISFLILWQDRDVALAGCPVHRGFFRSFQVVGPCLLLGRLKFFFIRLCIESFSPQHMPKLWCTLFMNFDEVSNFGHPLSTVPFEVMSSQIPRRVGDEFTYPLNSRSKRRFL